MRGSVRRLIPVVCILGALGGAVIAQPANPQGNQPAGQPGGPGRGPGGGGGGGGGGGQPGQGPGGRNFQQNTEGVMRAMNRAARDLKGTIGDASKNEQSLMSVWAMQQACAGAKRTTPQNLQGDPAKAVLEFRRDLIKLMGMIIDLEGQLMDGKNAEAKATFAKIEEFRDAAHKRMGIQDEDEGDAPPAQPRGQ